MAADSPCASACDAPLNPAESPSNLSPSGVSQKLVCLSGHRRLARVIVHPAGYLTEYPILGDVKVAVSGRLTPDEELADACALGDEAEAAG